MTDAFVRNLKQLNAKERDHLMRFAYLGQTGDYAGASTFLSGECDEQLKKHAVAMGLTSSAQCVFAGMDYHLDWLFAALWIAKVSPTWDPGADELPSGVLAAHKVIEDIKPLYTDFRPISGSQEDVDLLVVYRDEDKLAVLFIEAKGSAKFDRVQLARKLIRLDRILVETGMTPQQDQVVKFRLILAAPKEYKPNFKCCRGYALGLPKLDVGNPDKYSAMRDALKEENHSSGIGNGLHFLEIRGFPEVTHAVERKAMAGGNSGDDAVESALGRGAFTHWTLRERK